MDLRRRGRRAAPPPAAHGARGGSETFLNREQMTALHHTFTSSLMAAVRQVLHGELLRGGICVQRRQRGRAHARLPEAPQHASDQVCGRRHRLVPYVWPRGRRLRRGQGLVRQRRRLPGASTLRSSRRSSRRSSASTSPSRPAGRPGLRARVHRVHPGRPRTTRGATTMRARVYVRDKPTRPATSSRRRPLASSTSRL